ncbi:MAG: hypothetical protein KDA51_09060, partial [Planctomycetales bacterium]|nr:hypothetical protein [Planctomycetales bacterium]
MGGTEESIGALRETIEQSIALEQYEIELGGSVFAWHRPADPERLLEAAAANTLNAPESIDPFWATTWRAAVGLDRFLQRLDLVGKRVLELGCGSGQAGVAAAARGALVTLTDSVLLALQVARLNAWPLRAQIETRVLIWGTTQLDSGPYPIIIGSDLVFDPSLFPVLESSARCHLAPGGTLYLSEPHRHTGDKFATWICDRGWRAIQHNIDLTDHRVPIR